MKGWTAFRIARAVHFKEKQDSTFVLEQILGVAIANIAKGTGLSIEEVEAL